jgi:hypothetical protein
VLAQASVLAPTHEDERTRGRYRITAYRGEAEILDRHGHRLAWVTITLQSWGRVWDGHIDDRAGSAEREPWWASCAQRDQLTIRLADGRTGRATIVQLRQESPITTVELRGTGPPPF